MKGEGGEEKENEAFFFEVYAIWSQEFISFPLHLLPSESHHFL